MAQGGYESPCLERRGATKSQGGTDSGREPGEGVNHQDPCILLHWLMRYVVHLARCDNPTYLSRPLLSRNTGTNTYLIGQGPSRILLDTGEGKQEWLSSLKSALASEKASISTCLLSHWHPDHISGVDDLRSIASQCKIYKNRPDYRGDEAWSDIKPGQTFETEGATLRAVHCPGHTEDHMAFLLEEEGAMFTADNVLGHGTAVFEDLKAYMESLGVMKAGFEGRAYPGHGEVIEDGLGKIEEYIAHRKQREQEVLKVLSNKNEKAGGASDWTPMQVVKVVYKDYPEELHAPAEGGVVQILKKLEIDGRVASESEGKRWKLNGSSNL